MAEQKKEKRLKKELKLLDIYAIGTGATLSSGFFLLPGIVAAIVGPTLVISYLLAALPLIPAMFSLIELSTAMPRAGGVYYFLDRTLGPYMGTIGGLGTWLALILKVAFALVGMGVYISIFIPDFEIKYLTIIIAFILGIISLFGAKKSTKLQVFLVIIIIGFLAVFILGGLIEIEPENFTGVFNIEYNSILATAGMVYLSYMGIIKIASLSEEVYQPEKNLPLGMILTTISAVIIYGLGTAAIVGLVPMENLIGDLTPVASAAEVVFGKAGKIVITIIALLAFISVANAGLLSASRYPIAMSRDHLLPRVFRRLGKNGTPFYSIILTVFIIVVILFFLDASGIAKLASAFLLLMFAFVCFAVVIMRESKIESYDPGYRSPLYPWMQIIGIIVPFIFIAEMGLLTILFTLSLIIACSLWYWFYARKRVARTGAIFHIFERLGQQRYKGLDSELRGILKEKGLRDEDPFDEIVSRSIVLDLTTTMTFDNVVSDVSNKLSRIINLKPEEIRTQIMDGTRIGATPVTHGVALPHFRTDRLEQPEMVLVRSKNGVKVPLFNPLTHEEEEKQSVNAIFFLVSPEKNPTQHLRILAQIAGRVDDDNFTMEWQAAQDDQQLREVMLNDERFLSLCIEKHSKTCEMIDKPLRQVYMPKGCLVTMLRRRYKVIVPNGNTFIEEGDRLTIIGDPNGMKELRKYYIDERVSKKLF